MKIRPEDALEYHSTSPAGKLAVTPTKPCRTQRDLSLAYTPGVAVPCLEIERDPSLAYKYTSKGNLVGVVSTKEVLLAIDVKRVSTPIREVMSTPAYTMAPGIPPSEPGAPTVTPSGSPEPVQLYGGTPPIALSDAE